MSGLKFKTKGGSTIYTNKESLSVIEMDGEYKAIVAGIQFTITEDVFKTLIQGTGPKDTPETVSFTNKKAGKKIPAVEAFE